MKLILIGSMLFSLSVFGQTQEKPDPNSSVNAQEQVNGLPGNSPGTTYSVRTKKRALQAPAVVAPVENHTPANCADSLGGKGSNTFTACEAGKKMR